ncbi:MAG: hypothetical protein JO165_00475 [Candidatus Eremiobacteraeota bacterium]|nr:hypothetical protein [Candidatus Eremiobacteraeota bacterium]
MLRPLRIGEIFDRAVTLCVTNFVPFAIIALFFVVPLAIAGIFQQRDTAQTWQEMIDAARGHAIVPRTNSSTALMLQIGVFLYFFIGAPFAHMAISAAVAQRYNGHNVQWKAALAASLSRWAAALGLMFFASIIFVAAIFGGSLGLGVIIGVSAVIASAAKAVAIGFGVLAIVLFVVWLLFIMVLFVAVFFMFFALVVERAPLFTALGSGFMRIFNRKELLRATTMGLAFLALEIALTAVSYTIIGVVDIWWHAFVGGALALSVVNLLTVLFSATLFTVYYFDVRVRREALDAEPAVPPFVPVAQP